MEIKHFIVEDAHVRQFSASEGKEVAAGERLLPEYADCKLRYVQVMVGKETMEDDGSEAVQVHIAGAYLRFDKDGRLEEANAQPNEEVDKFEHETCVQLALLDQFPDSITAH